MRWVFTGALVALMVLGVSAAAGYLWLDARAAALAGATMDVALDSISVPTDSLSLAEGERAAWLRGCHGCHGDSLQGKVFVDEPRVIRLTPPNLTAAIATYSNAEFARAIRHGVSRAGRPLIAMPSATFYHLSDVDVGRIIAHVRAAPRHPNVPAPTELRILTKIGLIRGEVPTDAGTMDHAGPRLGARGDTSRIARGEYLSMTICTECHGMELRGQDETPALPKALGYTLPQFVSLMWDGRARDGRDIGLMGTTARRRFSRFRRDEIEAVWVYLQSMSLVAPKPAGP